LRRSIVAVMTLLFAVGCAGDPVAWKETSYAPPPRPAQLPPGTILPAGGGCPVSVRATRAGSAMFASWWVVRPDSSAQLVVDRSHDGGESWELLVVADSTDHSVRGCARPAPAIALDSATGYVNVAYFMEPQSGSGIFFSHSMDGGLTFHAPVPIVFGDNPSSVGIATSGDRVVVAYEDPNSTEPSVGVALSRTLGHIFEHREIVSSDNERAREPVVELGGNAVRVWWSNYPADPRISATRTAYREGVWDEHR
jgi:hypothetical protein